MRDIHLGMNIFHPLLGAEVAPRASLNLPLFELAVVESFNFDLSTDFVVFSYGKSIEHLAGDRSGDMTGRLRLADGRVMSFDYNDWVEPIRIDGWVSSYGDFNLRGARDFPGDRARSTPEAGNVIMVNVQDGAVKLWAWPHAVLYEDGARYPDLYCVVDVSQETEELIKDLRGRQHHWFGPQAVYAGPDPAVFLKGPNVPKRYLVQRWDRDRCLIIFE